MTYLIIIAGLIGLITTIGVISACLVAEEYDRKEEESLGRTKAPLNEAGPRISGQPGNPSVDGPEHSDGPGA